MTRWTLSLALLLALSCPLASAEPPHDKHNKHDKGQAHKRSHSEQQHYQRSPDVREAIIREILREAGLHSSHSSALPPGIRKNLERGKPLPPGIAKKLDPGLRSRLPDYEGYEWRQVGRDLILVAVTTGIIEAILSEVF